MPKQTSQSVLASKLGDKGRKAFDAHKNDEVELGGSFAELPAGMSGVARLKECRFGIIKEGKQGAGSPYFYAVGIVVSPKTFNDKQGNTHFVEGRRTSIIEGIYETPTKKRVTVDDHLKFVINELQKLGLPTSGLTLDNLETAVATLEEAKPYFKFRTWQGEKQTTGKYKDKEPLVNHVWEGAIPDYKEEQGDDDGGPVDDESAPAGRNGAPKVVNRVAGKMTKVEEEEEETGAEFNEFENEDEEDLIELARQADEDEDAKAKSKLKAKALEAGLTNSDIKNAESWSEVVTLIEKATGGDDEGDDSPPDEGDQFLYKPPASVKHPRTKGAFKSAIVCEVTAVNKSKKTVNLSSVDHDLTFNNVSWSEITRPE